MITIVCLGPVTIHLTATNETGSPDQNQIVTRLISNLQTGAALERAMATPAKLPATTQARPAAKAPAATGHTCPICGKAISRQAAACHEHRSQVARAARLQAEQDAQYTDAHQDGQQQDAQQDAQYADAHEQQQAHAEGAE